MTITLINLDENNNNIIEVKLAIHILLNDSKHVHQFRCKIIIFHH